MFNIFKSKKKLDDRIAELEESLWSTLDKVFEEKELNKKLVAEINRLKEPRRKNRKQLSHKTGFTKVGQVESHDMYEMYQGGMNVDAIAIALGRSQSCISRHIRKHMEE